jgi:hypothetical protein
MSRMSRISPKPREPNIETSWAESLSAGHPTDPDGASDPPPRSYSRL